MQRSRCGVAHLPPLDQLALLRGGQLEIGVVHHAEDYDDIEQELLFEGEPLVAYLPPEHPLSRQTHALAR